MKWSSKLKNVDSCVFPFEKLEPGDHFSFEQDLEDHVDISYMKLADNLWNFVAVDSNGCLIDSNGINPKDKVVYREKKHEHWN